MQTSFSRSWRSVHWLVIVAAVLAGCDSPPSSAPDSTDGPHLASQMDPAVIAYRKTLPPVPSSLQPLARELEQLFKQQKRVSLNAQNGPIPRVALPGALPYRMTEGGKMIEVDLNYTPVTDDFLKKLATLSDLETLDLNGTMVTDAGLENLTAARALKVLSILRTQVTESGADKFREAHPKCKVVGPAETKAASAVLRE